MSSSVFTNHLVAFYFKLFLKKSALDKDTFVRMNKWNNLLDSVNYNPYVI